MSARVGSVVQARSCCALIASLVLLVVTLTGCDGSTEKSEPVSSDSIATTPSSAKLLCGIVPRDAAGLPVGEKALARRVDGSVDRDASGHLGGFCTIPDSSSDTVDPALFVHIALVQGHVLGDQG